MEKKRNVCLIFNPKVSKERLVVDNPQLASAYIIEPNENDIGDESVDLQGKKSIQVFIESAEMSMRGFGR